MLAPLDRRIAPALTALSTEPAIAHHEFGISGIVVARPGDVNP
jgi:hypothetical protein